MPSETRRKAITIKIEFFYLRTRLRTTRHRKSIRKQLKSFQKKSSREIQFLCHTAGMPVHFDSRSRKLHFSCPSEWKLRTPVKCEIKIPRVDSHLLHSEMDLASPLPPSRSQLKSVSDLLDRAHGATAHDQPGL